MTDTDGQVVPVEIHGQRYSIRTSLAPEYVAQLAAYVGEKMRAAADSSAPTDSLRLAVLAALNIADEYLVLKQKYDSIDSDYHARAEQLSGALDEVLEEVRRAG